mmetsp:Transcript_6714/g.16533  ORF Transcript_6714/g.16533 Transcript_6714/m.16533 type:complete len:87 (+) Transcript_6714:233-493(+)
MQGTSLSSDASLKVSVTTSGVSGRASTYEYVGNENLDMPHLELSARQRGGIKNSTMSHAERILKLGLSGVVVRYRPPLLAGFTMDL